jgi:hypothetical protein
LKNIRSDKKSIESVLKKLEMQSSVKKLRKIDMVDLLEDHMIFIIQFDFSSNNTEFA